MKKLTGHLLIILISLVVLKPACHAEALTMAVLPFTVTSESSLNYLDTALIDLFSSRIALKNQVNIVDKETAVNLYRGSNLPPQQRIIEVGRKTQARYVLTGSLDESAAGITLQVFVVDTGTEKPIHEYTERSAQFEGTDAIIPLVDIIAAKVNSDIFSRGSASEDVTPQEASKPYNIHAHPDTLLEFVPKEEKK
jgi:TolB-like protein